MSASEITSLTGTIAAYLIGGVVFLVLFFKAIHWADAWMKQKTFSEKVGTRKPTSKFKKKMRPSRPSMQSAMNSSIPQERPYAAGRSEIHASRAQKERRDKVASRESAVAQRQRALQQKALQDLEKSSIPDGVGVAKMPATDDSKMIKVATTNSGLKDRNAKGNPSGLARGQESMIANQDQVVSAGKESQAAKAREWFPSEANSVLSVHLTCGEMIDQVSILTSDDADFVRKQLGYSFGNNVVAKGRDGQIFVIREENIKLLVWGPERVRTIASIQSDLEVKLPNDSRDDSSIRRTIP